MPLEDPDDLLTPNISLIKPAVGSEVGEDKWGAKLNQNFDVIDAQVYDLRIDVDSFVGIQEAPQDGIGYLRRSADWYAVDIPIIPGLQDALDAKIGEAPGDGALYGRNGLLGLWEEIGSPEWDEIIGKPGAFPPAAHQHAQSDVIDLVADQAAQDTAIAGKEPKITAGTPTDFWRGDKTWAPLSSITVDAYTKAESDARYEPFDSAYTKAEADARYEPFDSAYTKAEADARYIGDAPADNQQYARKNNTWSQFTIPAPAPAVGLVDVGDTPPASPLDNQLWLESDSGTLYCRVNDGNSTQWVDVSGAATATASGLPEAPNDGKSYARRSLGWFDLSATFASYLPLGGGVLTGDLFLDKTAANAARQLIFSLNAQVAWQFNYATDGNFYLTRANPVGTLVANPLTFTPAGAITIAGPTAITLAGPTVVNGTLTVGDSTTQGLLYLNKMTGTAANSIYGSTAGSLRWRLDMGDSIAESGGNAGSNFAIHAWSDTGAYLNTPIGINRTGSTSTVIRFGGHIYPLSDNANYVGNTGARWYQVWAVTGTIQTSDENEKRDIRSLDEMERQAAQAMKGLIVAYRWRLEAVPKDEGKINIGVIAQRVEQCLRDAGLDPDAYAMWRKDKVIISHEAVRDTEGNITEDAWEEETDEYRYSVDYNQMLAFIIGGL